MNQFKTVRDCDETIERLRSLTGTEDIIRQILERRAQLENDLDNTYFFRTLIDNYPYGVMPDNKRKCIEETVDLLLQDGENAIEPGLLLGHIQCGKTDTFEKIVALSFDKGIDVVIVFTKGTNPLTIQTIKRMEKDYIYFRDRGNINDKVISIYDIMRLKSRGIRNSEVTDNRKVVIVCKKEFRNLQHLINLFDGKSSFLKEKRVLIVDDEADFASRNYLSEKCAIDINIENVDLNDVSEAKLAKISKAIDELRSKPHFCRYLQVTATPYCLYLQPKGEVNLKNVSGGSIYSYKAMSFRPRFTREVPVHDNYIGGKHYFELSRDESSMYNNLYHQIDIKGLSILEDENKKYLDKTLSSFNLKDVVHAILAYFVATAIRRIQCRKEGKSYKSSAVIHIEIGKEKHSWQKRLINKIINDLYRTLRENGIEGDRRVCLTFNYIYEDFLESNEKGRNEGLISVEMPSKEEILHEVLSFIGNENKDYEVYIVNSNEDVKSLLNEDGELELTNSANIFIGGNILDRGITIKNMLCFFYGRDPKKFQQDTVMQHARFYGARSKEDMSVTRLHTTDYIYRVMSKMYFNDLLMRESLLKLQQDDSSDITDVPFIAYDKHIKPCSPSKTKISDIIAISSQDRVLPIGMWIGTKKDTTQTMKEIDELIESTPGYNEQDEYGFFVMEKARMAQILRKIASTYVYNEKRANLDRKEDMTNLLCALDNCTQFSDGKIYVRVVKDRNVKRIKRNGAFLDSPEDGNTDLKYAHEKAKDIPVVTLLHQLGNRAKDEFGEDVGWSGAPFYWPVLMTQGEIIPSLYCFNQKRAVRLEKQHRPLDVVLAELGIDKSEVLHLTYKGNLVSRFGEEGAEYDYDEAPMENRAIKKTTASRYICVDENGKYMIDPDVEFYEEEYNGLYSLNREYFPFVLKPYKYLSLSNMRDESGDLMIVELFEPEKWELSYVLPNEKGSLIDPFTKETLTYASDIIQSKKMKETEYFDETICLWILAFVIKRVIKYEEAQPVEG